MRLRILTAAAASTALFIIPVVGLAWEGARVAELAAGSAASGCPVKAATQCPATAQVEMARLAIAAERGCPVSTTQLIERSKRCTDPLTVSLAAKAAAGDQKAKAELIKRVKMLGDSDQTPADPSTIA